MVPPAGQRFGSTFSQPGLPVNDRPRWTRTEATMGHERCPDDRNVGVQREEPREELGEGDAAAGPVPIGKRLGMGRGSQAHQVAGWSDHW